jgi:hypothetical protein
MKLQSALVGMLVREKLSFPVASAVASVVLTSDTVPLLFIFWMVMV